MKVLECTPPTIELVSLRNRPPESGPLDSWHVVQERSRAFAVSLHSVLVGKPLTEACAK